MTFVKNLPLTGLLFGSLLDSILFSDKPIKDKRIEIRKLKRKGLSTIFIKMFMKLLEYIAEV